MSISHRFTVTDLDLLPEDGNRYEIIDGDLYVTTQPHWYHQLTSGRIVAALMAWSDQTGAGVVAPAPGVIFAPDQAVAPDLVWTSQERVERILGADGKLHAAPDLIVEVLSPGRPNEDRDRVLKLRLYSRYGVREYWIVDWRDRTIQLYRREQAALQLVGTLTADDTVTSPLLPGFAARVRDLCAAPPGRSGPADG
ncbi:MAG: Uma2 family endonuclease [Chloroflexi bacterium]|nr:Uma2 family endonuclease [Chloroflexota bacterium]